MLIHTLKSLIATLSVGLMFTVADSVQAADPGIGESTITLGMSAPFSGPNGASRPMHTVLRYWIVWHPQWMRRHVHVFGRVRRLCIRRLCAGM